MTDVHSKETRSKNMSAIKSKNTKPELLIADILNQINVSYRSHDGTLPGKPDFVIPTYRAVIFVHGCFWHGHDDCHLFKLPKSRKEFWNKKITDNKTRDMRNIKELKKEGWWVLEIWECSLKGKTKLAFDDLVKSIEHWVLYEMKSKSIRGFSEKVGSEHSCF